MFNLQRLPVIYQSEVSECGLACLGMIASYHGKEIDLPSLRRRFPVSIKGATFNDLIQIANDLQLCTRPLRVELEALEDVRLPAVLHWEFSHFVVLKSIGIKNAVVHDPAIGNRTISLSELSDCFTGVVLELTPAIEFTCEKQIEHVRLRDIFCQTTGIAIPLMQVLAFSLIIQAFAVVTPFFSQLAIDKVVPTGDIGMLRVLALGFGILFVLNPLVNWMRSRLIMLVSAQLSAQLTTNIVKALLSLPLTFFEKRSIGDLLTRLEAAESLRDLLSEGFVAVVVDSLLAVLTLAMMFYYAPILAVVVLVVTILMALLRLGFVPTLQRMVNDQLQKQGAEQSELIETLRGITSVKFARKEKEREAIWSRAFMSLVSSSTKLSLVESNFNLSRELVQNLGYVLIVYLGIGLIIDSASTFTVGAFFAFMSYQSMFFERVENFLGQMIQLSMTRMHLERLSEIVMEEPEPPVSEIHRLNLTPFSLTLNNLGFHYESEKEPILHGLSAMINAGERIALYAPSGAGKTTLLKLLTGIYEPTEGTLALSNTRITKAGMTMLRSHIAAVLQDDYLFKGSIIDNISFFDAQPDMERVIYCAGLACIDEEITTMPMSYDSFVGEMGTSLSQGQQQRILIARALYQQKPMLVLDEGTANLDDATEAKLLNNLVDLGITMILAGHNPNLALYATRIWRMEESNSLHVTNVA